MRKNRATADHGVTSHLALGLMPDPEIIMSGEIEALLGQKHFTRSTGQRLLKSLADEIEGLRQLLTQAPAALAGARLIAQDQLAGRTICLACGSAKTLVYTTGRRYEMKIRTYRCAECGSTGTWRPKLP